MSIALRTRLDQAKVSIAEASNRLKYLEERIKAAEDVIRDKAPDLFYCDRCKSYQRGSCECWCR